MKRIACAGLSGIVLCVCLGAGLQLCAQAALQADGKNTAEREDQLQFVLLIGRHGVRSPTGKPEKLNQYSQQPWPSWSVPAGYLTEHGARLMTLFGAYDRELLAAEGLLKPAGCEDASHIRIVADSDQRTRETGKALAAGLAAGCAIAVKALPEGTPDPLFHSLAAGVGKPDKLLAAAQVSGRIGANPQGLAEAYRPQLEALEEVLRGCKPGAECAGTAAAQSLFDIPSSLAPGQGDHLVELRTPLSTASTMAENLLLEYTEGMNSANVGWGRVDLHKLRELLQLHTASEDIAQRTDYVARVQSSNLLSHALQSIEQAVTAQPVTGALTHPGDRLLILVGHDTNLANVGGALGLSWLIDGRRDDTPPGGALVFELWKRHGAGELSVKTFYMAQTLEQMRNATPLSLASPPERVPVFVPGCGRADGTCTWKDFQKAVRTATRSTFIR